MTKSIAYPDSAPFNRRRRKALPILLGALAAIALGIASRALLAAVGIPAPYIAFVPWIVAAGLVTGSRSALLSLAGFVTIGALSLRPTTFVLTRSPLVGLLFFACDGLIVVGIIAWINRTRARMRSASAVLRESEQRLRMALEAGHMGTWEWTIPSGVVIWSPGLERIHGRCPGTFKRTFEDVLSDIHPEDRQRFTSAVQDAVTNRASDYRIEYRIIKTGREERWLEARGSVLCDERGEPQRMMGVCMDVSDRKRAEQAVQRSEQQMRIITDALPALIAYVDRDQRYQFVSKAYEKWLNRPLDEIRGKRIADIARGYEGLRPYIETALAGKPVHFQVRVTYPDGVTRDAGVTYSPDIGADGVVNGYAVLVVDESDRRRAEVERERLLAAERSSREAAERAGRTKDEFLAVLSHELRTPLTPVLLIVSRLERSLELPESIREDVASIRRSIELEARLIDDLLDVTRISRGKVRYDFQTVELHALVRSAMSICCGDDKLPVSADFAASRTLVHGDPGRLQQVFCNLLNNAWKFTPPGGSVAVHTENADRFIRVDITDTGPGIDPEVLPRIFEAFEQGDAARARRFGGLGLGLAISKAMVDAHEGRISASSQGHGQGARFRVELPTVSAPLSAGRDPANLPAHPVEQRKLRVLVVEDHPSTLRALAKLLSAMGHEVDGATSVADGLRVAGEGRYDLLVSDLSLPDGTGYDLMRQLRSTLGLRGIALSGYGMEEDIARSREAGFAEHLVKPVDLQTLQAAIGRFGMERAADPDEPAAVQSHEEPGPG